MVVQWQDHWLGFDSQAGVKSAGEMVACIINVNVKPVLNSNMWVGSCAVATPEQPKDDMHTSKCTQHCVIKAYCVCKAYKQTITS